MGQFEAALKLYEASLSVRKATYGITHPTVAQSLNNIAGVKYKLGDYNGAVAMYERSIDIKTKLYGIESADVALTLNNIAVLHMAAGKLTSAVHSQEQAVQLLEKVLGPDHPNTVNVKGNLGISYKRMGVQAIGDKLVGEALQYLADRNYSTSHPWVKKFSQEVVKFSNDYTDDSVSISPSGRNSGKFITPERTKRATVKVVSADGEEPEVDVEDVRLDRIDSDSEESDEEDEDEVNVDEVRLDIQHEIGYSTGEATLNRFGDSDEVSLGSHRSNRSSNSKGSKGIARRSSYQPPKSQPMTAQQRLEALAATSSSRQEKVMISDRTTRRKSTSGSDNSTGIRPKRQGGRSRQSGSSGNESSGAASGGASEGSSMA
jgi:tetratricopeptide (TPR) repeat protein